MIDLLQMAIAAGVLSMTTGVVGYPQAQSVSPCALQEPVEGMICHDFYSERQARNVPIWVNSNLIQVTDKPPASSGIDAAEGKFMCILLFIPVTDISHRQLGTP